MSDRDIVAELRRLYEAAPQGEWEYSGPFNDGDSAGYIEVRDSDGDWWPVVGIGIDRPEVIHLIVAMHSHLPALLDAIDTLRWYADRDHYNEDGIPGIESRFAPDGWLKDYGERARVAVALLKLLKRSDG